MPRFWATPLALLALAGGAAALVPRRGRTAPRMGLGGRQQAPQVAPDATELLADFKQGPELFELRRQVDMLERQLKHLERTNKVEDAESVRQTLEETYAKDPLAVYTDFRGRMWDAAREGLYDRAAHLRDAAKEIQEYLPQYNLEGLWVGNYGAHGYEIIKITYDNYRGDQHLIATKVTGDEHVQAGEVTFRVDLTPGRQQPPPLLVNVKGKQVELEAFGGKGVIAEKGGKSKQTVPGKLILFEENRFAFVWEPLGAHITFARVDEGIVKHMHNLG